MNTALNRTSVALLTNKSGGSVAQGDVVIVDSANASAFTTTTTSGYANGFVGVVLEPNGIASNATGAVAFGGYVPAVNLSASASLGDVFKAHSVAKQAVRHAAPIVAGDFGQVLGTGTSPAALLWGAPIGGSSGGGGGSLELKDGTTDLTSVTTITTTGLVVGGTSAAATLAAQMVRIAQTTLSATAASITFSAIPQTYTALKLVLSGLRDTSANSGPYWCFLQMNGDTAAHYDWAEAQVNTSSSINAAITSNSSSAGCGYCIGGSSPAADSGTGTVMLYNYASGTLSTNGTAQAAGNDATNGFRQVSLSFRHQTAAATTSITLFPQNGSFAAGCSATLYGIL